MEVSGWCLFLLNEGDGAAAHWLLSHANAAEMASDVLVTAPPVNPALLAAMRPRLLVLRPAIVRLTPSGEPVASTDPFVPPPKLPTFVQRDSGAVTVLIYPDRLEATGFVDKHRIVLPKQLSSMDK